MQKELTRDAMVMVGDHRRALLAMSVPLLVSLLIAQVNTFIDTFWCSMLGSTALAAIGVVSSYYFILVGIGSGIGIGVSSVIAGQVARRDKDSADRTATQSIVFMTLIGLLCTPVMLLVGDPVLEAVMGDAYAESVAYARPYYLAAVVLVLQGVLAGILRGEGAARRSMVVMTLAAVLNIILDPLLTFQCGLGIGGLAWATVVSTTISLLPVAWWYLVRSETTYVDLRREHLRPRRDVVGEFVSVGAPRALELDIMWGLNFVNCFLVGVCGGSDAVAIYTTGWKFVDIISIPANALAGALVPVCSAAFAVRDLGKMRSAYRYTMVRAVIVTAVLALMLFLLSDQAVRIFSNNETSAALEGPMAEAIRIYVLVAVMFAAISVSSSLLQSMRMARASMWSTLLRNILLIATFAWLCQYTPTDIWWGFVAVEVAGLVLMCGWAELGWRRVSAHVRGPQFF